MDVLMRYAHDIAQEAEVNGEDPEFIAEQYVGMRIADMRKVISLAKRHYGLKDSEWPEDFLYAHRWFRLRQVEKRLDKRL